MSEGDFLILGAGMTGLAAGLVSGFPVYEAEDKPGGICGSYYIKPSEKTRLDVAPPGEEAYRFERGGGHWIFGGDHFVLRFIGAMAAVKPYVRKSAVYLPEQDLKMPYPIQNHLRFLGRDVAAKALREMLEAKGESDPSATMAEWLRASFGPTLGRVFFEPFHELYTAGLWRQIKPQDSYKSPVSLSLAIHGAIDEVPPAGYNVNFLYPIEGLNTLAQRMAARCVVRYRHKVVWIDTKANIVHFEDGAKVPYRALLSTLPLNRTVKLSEERIDETPDPSVSVLVINIGARKGNRCPDDHWVYLPTSRTGFHRVGFYSNVDTSFLPRSFRTSGDRVSIYVEKAYRDGERPEGLELASLCREIVRELQEWQWIDEPEVVDPTWIDVAYTWSWCGSRWKEKALQALESRNIHQVGRFGRWVFQGIADSIRDGLVAGAVFKAR
jgi:protoporphyrinogen oxidase